MIRQRFTELETIDQMLPYLTAMGFRITIQAREEQFYVCVGDTLYFMSTELESVHAFIYGVFFTAFLDATRTQIEAITEFREETGLYDLTFIGLYEEMKRIGRAPSFDREHKSGQFWLGKIKKD